MQHPFFHQQVAKIPVLRGLSVPKVNTGCSMYSRAHLLTSVFWIRLTAELALLGLSCENNELPLPACVYTQTIQECQKAACGNASIISVSTANTALYQ